MDRPYRTRRRRDECTKTDRLAKLIGSDLLGTLDLDKRIILSWIFENSMQKTFMLYVDIIFLDQ
jgi:hypothetical protein